MAPENADVTEEIPKPNLISTFDSQIADSSHLLSLPSEAPDIRDWFSSYEYESPAPLYLEGDSKGCKLTTFEEETDGEKEKIVERIENHKDTDDECVERSYDEFAKGERCLEGSEQECHLENKIADSSHLLSLPTEPKDIRNWFSSYQYESPATLGIEGDFQALTTLEEFDIEKEKTVEWIKNPEGPNDIDDDGCVKRPCDEFTKGERCLKEGSDKECHLEKKDRPSVELTESSPYLKSFLSTRIGENEQFRGQVLHKIPLMDKENLTVEDDESCQEKLSGKHLVLSEVYESPCKGQEKSMEKSIHRKHFQDENLERKNPRIYTSPRSNMDLQGLNGDYPLSNVKEEEGNDLANNGFISTRRNKTIRSNTRNISNETNGEVSSSENAGLLLHENKRKLVCDGRKALSYRSNFHMESNPEMSGKWQCPRKSKPFVRPPLKQLRLEQWVHRVQ